MLATSPTLAPRGDGKSRALAFVLSIMLSLSLLFFTRDGELSSSHHCSLLHRAIAFPSALPLQM
jgi:hypothetical protein